MTDTAELILGASSLAIAAAYTPIVIRAIRGRGRSDSAQMRKPAADPGAPTPTDRKTRPTDAA